MDLAGRRLCLVQHKNGIFIVTVITIVLAGFLVSLGMGGYARIQKWCFIGGLIGFAVVVGLLLFNSHASFISSFNYEAQHLFGVKNAYAATNHAAVKAGYTTSPFGFGPLGPTMLLVPAMMFFILWPNWGATLYGEIRGASDFRRVFSGMFIGLWITVDPDRDLLPADRQDRRLGLLPEPELAGLQRDAAVRHLAVPVPVRRLAGAQHGVPGHPAAGAEPVVLRLGGHAVPVLDPGHLRGRLRPGAADRAAEVSEKRKVPFYSLILMLAPAVILGAIYAYSATFRTYTLDATLVIAVTYLFSAIAVVILPFRKPDLWRASPASRIKIFGVQIVPVAGVITIGAARVQPGRVAENDNYFVNNHDSLIYMGAMYVLAIVIFVVARIVRSRQGIDLGLINKEIPVE